MKHRLVAVTAATAVVGIVAWSTVRRLVRKPAPRPESKIKLVPGPVVHLTHEELTELRTKQRRLRESLRGQVALRLLRRKTRQQG
jgi:hypothetical protein